MMDRKTVLAFFLIFAIAVVPSVLLKRPKPVGPADRRTAGPTNTVPAERDSSVAEKPNVLTGTEAPSTTARQPASPPDSTETQVEVESPIYRYTFSTLGARLVGATLKDYRSFARGETGPVQLIPEPSEFLAYRLVSGHDTLDLSQWRFEPSTTRLDLMTQGSELTWVAHHDGVTVELHQVFSATDYRFDVKGTIRGGGIEGGLVLVGLGPGFRLVEADSIGDFRSYGLVTKARSTENTAFTSLDPGERTELSGPFEWAALKSKYFAAAVLTIDPGAPQLGGVVAVGGPRSGKNATRVHAVASLPAPGGMFGHSVWVGPQEYRRLQALGHDFPDVNPYGWFLRPIIHPVSIVIVKVLLWMHETLSLAYGWVLVLFGIAVRLILWPLNQKAMRSSIAMQAIQPELKEIQDRHKKDPQKLQQEMMRLYKEHGVNPLGGCLPLLLPMPVLFALFFVFGNTIEFRGVPFLWLPDLSRADPLYVIPIVMGISMFGLSKVGTIGVPPNPQTKMMLYFMPIMMTVLFLNFSSGLNLYYAVSNITSIPQQWFVAKERLRRMAKK